MHLIVPSSLGPQPSQYWLTGCERMVSNIRFHRIKDACSMQGSQMTHLPFSLTPSIRRNSQRHVPQKTKTARSNGLARVKNAKYDSTLHAIRVVHRMQSRAVHAVTTVSPFHLDSRESGSETSPQKRVILPWSIPTNDIASR